MSQPQTKHKKIAAAFENKSRPIIFMIDSCALSTSLIGDIVGRLTKFFNQHHESNGDYCAKCMVHIPAEVLYESCSGYIHDAQSLISSMEHTNGEHMNGEFDSCSRINNVIDQLKNIFASSGQIKILPDIIIENFDALTKKPSSYFDVIKTVIASSVLSDAVTQQHFRRFKEYYRAHGGEKPFKKLHSFCADYRLHDDVALRLGVMLDYATGQAGYKTALGQNTDWTAVKLTPADIELAGALKAWYGAHYLHAVEALGPLAIKLEKAKEDIGEDVICTHVLNKSAQTHGFTAPFSPLYILVSNDKDALGKFEALEESENGSVLSFNVREIGHMALSIDEMLSKKGEKPIFADLPIQEAIMERPLYSNDKNFAIPGHRPGFNVRIHSLLTDSHRFLTATNL